MPSQRRNSPGEPGEPRIAEFSANPAGLYCGVVSAWRPAVRVVLLWHVVAAGSVLLVATVLSSDWRQVTVAALARYSI